MLVGRKLLIFHDNYELFYHLKTLLFSSDEHPVADNHIHPGVGHRRHYPKPVSKIIPLFSTFIYSVIFVSSEYTYINTLMHLCNALLS